jgi:hypothetical protein
VKENTLVSLAIGRLFRIMSRPYQEGDDAEYQRCRGIILDHAEGGEAWEPNWARDRLKGAQGD